ncbi:MAG: serine hydrolase [Acidobacteriota bacterium]|nr:serine hydrolase [Acidobacteriota bacterium]
MLIYLNFINRFVLLFAMCLLAVQIASAQRTTASTTPTTQQIVSKVDEYMNAAVKNYHYSGSILVTLNGLPIVKKSYGMANYELNVPNTSQTRFRIASITKQFTAMAVIILKERGKLNVTDSICKYLENCPAAWQPITIRNLLTHTSGIPNFRAMPRYAEFASDQRFTYTGFVDVFRDAPLQFTPGERYAYSNSGYFLLGLIIERVSGQSYAEFLRDNIFTPLGMKNSGYDDSRRLVPNRASGYIWNGTSFVNAPYINMVIPFAAGALYSTIEDLLIWDQALYAEKLVSRKSLEEMYTPFRGEYGYGVEISTRFNRQRIRHSGGINGFSNDFARFPVERVTVIVLGNNESAPSDNINNSLAAIVFGESYQMPIASIRDVLLETIDQKGVEAAVKQYRELKRTQAENYDFREFVLNLTGYDLLAAKKVKEAIEIFKLNVEAYPQSANTYDSLAEAYMLNGNKELAIKNYEKSLELNPQNRNAADYLKKLKSSN